MYMIDIDRDDNGKWGYAKSFDIFITDDKEVAFKRALDELKAIGQTIRGNDLYVKEIKEQIEFLLSGYYTGLKYHENKDATHYFDTDDNDLFFSYEKGSARFVLEVIDVDVDSQNFNAGVCITKI